MANLLRYLCFRAHSELDLFEVVSAYFGVEAGVANLNVFRNEFEDSRPCVSVAEDAPELTVPLEESSKFWILLGIVVNKFDGVLRSFEISIEFKGENMSISYLGSSLSFLKNLFLNIFFEEGEEAWRHFELHFLHAHDSWNEVVVASFVQKLELSNIVGFVVHCIKLEDLNEALRFPKFDA